LITTTYDTNTKTIRIYINAVLDSTTVLNSAQGFLLITNTSITVVPIYD